MSLNDTPRANRLHIGLYGRRNSGKSTLVNALTGQQVATVSAVPGTTTDPVYKAMELHGIGPVVFIDTAGFDDVGDLGKLRVEKTELAAKETDIALVLFNDADISEELNWVKRFQAVKTPVIAVVSQIDKLSDKGKGLAARIKAETGKQAIMVSATNGKGIDALRAEMIRQLPEDYEQESITGSLCQSGDVVLLVMPQDIQAPKGRLILPQVQTLRELLDKKCLVMSCTTDCLENTLAALTKPPKLIITDSQAFKAVHALKPAASLLTSFSVLFAGFKGDINYFVESAKLPRLLRKTIGEDLQINITAGRDFPKNLSGIDFVIHCGACMFNRKYVLSRVAECQAQNVPMSNYGVTIAALLGILADVELPK